MRYCVRFLAPGLLLAVLPLAAFAEAEPPHPIVDVPRVSALSAEALRNSEIHELQAQRAVYVEQLDPEIAASTPELEQQLLQALLVYDDERVRIIDLIPEIIELYELNATLKSDMLNFRRTLTKIVAELRPEVTTLQKYKPYDFRIGVSYAALMTILQRQKSIRDRMLRDQEDPETLLGQHSARLQQTYRGVEQARLQLELAYRAETLKEQIDRIDSELLRRSQS